VEKPELVVVSTLTRALQTACLVFKKFKDLKIIATPIVCELGKIPENTPRSIEELKKDYNLQMLPGFDRIDFSNVSAEMKMIGVLNAYKDHGKSLLLRDSVCSTVRHTSHLSRFLPFSPFYSLRNLDRDRLSKHAFSFATGWRKGLSA